MKKKYPDKWRQVVSRHMNGLARYLQRKNSNGMSIETSFNWESMLEDMDAAGMLKDVSVPLEVEYCVEHKSAKGVSGCCQSVNFDVFNGDCRFVKLREVEE